MAANRIVYKAQTGTLLVIPTKRDYIEKCVAYHLGFNKIGFDSSELVEDMVENANETHFQINKDIGATLRFTGNQAVKHADVLSGGQPITMMVRISGGANVMLHTPMLIFQNQNRSYPIRGVKDNIPGVFLSNLLEGMDECCDLGTVIVALLGTWDYTERIKFLPRLVQKYDQY